MADLRGELTDLVHSYAHHADAFEIDAFIGLFAEGTLIELPQEQLTLTAFRAMMEQNQRDTQGLAPRHLLSNLRFTSIDEHLAEGSVYFTYQQMLEGRPTALMSGVYGFTLTNAGGRWRITRWLVQPDEASPAG